MNAFNRIFMTLLAVALVAGTGLVLAVQLGFVRPEAFVEPLNGLLGGMLAWEFQTRLSVIGGGLVLLPLSLLLLALELRPPTRSPAQLLVSDGARGRVQISRQSVQAIVARAGLEVPGVADVVARIDTNRRGLSIRAQVEVDPASPVPRLADEVQQRVKSAVEAHLGRAVEEVRVDARVGTLAQGQRVR